MSQDHDDDSRGLFVDDDPALDYRFLRRMCGLTGNVKRRNALFYYGLYCPVQSDQMHWDRYLAQPYAPFFSAVR